MLFPKTNSKRSIICLDGIWQMKTVGDDYVPTQKATDTFEIAVPASMNEQLIDNSIKEYCGRVLYEREFSCPIDADKKQLLHIGALSHRAKIYLNGALVGETHIGFLPFDFEVELKESNRLSIIIDNRLTYQTLPVGEFDFANNKQKISFDFYNYTGIHRSVSIYNVPKEYIKDVTVRTFVDGEADKIFVEVSGVSDATVTVTDEDGARVIENAPANTALTIKDAKLWGVGEPYLYTLKVMTEHDEYELCFGIRRIEVDEKSFKINGKPVYFKGFGRHEDFHMSGKGTNLPLLIRDMNLMSWVNANSFRTSHYPYGEEIYDYADRHGLLIIDEVPAVTMNWFGGDEFSPEKFNDKTLEVHKASIEHLMARDKNHPSVVMLSVANEPNTKTDASREYFSEIARFARKVTDLPLTLVQFEQCQDDKCADLFDVVCINRYYSWYSDHGNLDVVEGQMHAELCKWFEKYHKPIIVAEFGADTIEGIHAIPPVSFSEEYQQEMIDRCCRAFDKVDFCIGEHVWNFADFKTKQGLTRINGNRKGVFTRERQPKMVAHYLKKRWSQI